MDGKMKKGKKMDRLSGDKATIAKAYDGFIRSIRKDAGNREYFEQIYDLRGRILKRREAAAFSLLSQAKERYSGKFPRVDVAQSWAILCSGVSFSASMTEMDNHITLAAAIFMLDEIKRMKKLADAFEYFPTNERTVEAIDLPVDFFDPCHEDEVLKGMVCLIENKLKGADWKNKLYTEASAEIALGECPPIREPSDGLTYTERFDAVFSFVPQIYKDRAVKRFEDKLWEFIDLYFARDNELAERAEELQSESDGLFKQCQRLKEYLDTRETIPHPPQKGPVVLNQGPVSFDISTLLWNREYMDRRDTERDRLIALSQRGLEINDELDEIDFERAELAQLAHMTYCPEGYPEDDVAQTKGNPFCDKLRVLTVEDPYEICFGFLCLLVSGSDLVWLYNPALAVLECAAAQLPWTVSIPEEEFDCDEALEEEDEQDDIAQGAELDEGDESEFSPIDWNGKKAELYARKYSDAGLYFPFEPPEDLKRLNLPQLVYSYTHMVMPRTVSEFDGMHEDLMNSGMEEGPAVMMELYLQLATSCQYASKNWRYFLGTRSFEYLRNGFLEAPEEKASPLPEEIEDKNREIVGLRATMDELKQALYAASREVRELQEKCAEQAREHEREKQELADLREIVFNANNDTEPETPKKNAITFPYQVKHRIVVFGGHDTWRNAIKPLLPNVTFIDRRALPNESLMRHADVIWLQVNALAHKHFYKIIDVSRTWKIPLRYFGYASAEKCARQLADQDALIVD